MAKGLRILAQSDERLGAGVGWITWRPVAGDPRDHQALKASNRHLLQARVSGPRT